MASAFQNFQASLSTGLQQMNESLSQNTYNPSNNSPAQQRRNIASYLKNLEIFWVMVSFIQIAAIVQYFRQFQDIWIVFVSWLLASIWATILTIRARAKLISSPVFSLFNLSFYVSCCTIITFYFSTSNSLLYPTLAYTLIQLIVSVFLSGCSQIILKVLYLFQLFVIVLRLDDRIKCEYSQVFFQFLILCLTSFMIVFTMIGLIVINVWCNNQRLGSLKNIVVGFILLNAVSASHGCMLPLSQSFFGCNTYVVGAISVFANITTIIYGRKFRTDLVSYFYQVKSQSTTKFLQLVKLTPSSLPLQSGFVKKSQYWYELVKLDAQTAGNKKQLSIQMPYVKNRAVGPNQHTNILNLQITASSGSQKIKCIICLEIRPCMVWMPCGHLTVCKKCCIKAFKTKNFGCLLCKSQPSILYQVEETSQATKDEPLKIRNMFALIQNQAQNFS